jgi:2-(1,2-epoxy-1,2-dihydrophenyl)acetyl-CoA isomerase
MSDADVITLSRTGSVATLTLNRPQALNALDLAMTETMVARASEVAVDDGVRCVVVRGAGGHFMAGGDIRTFHGFLELPPAERQSSFLRIIERLHASIETLQRMPKPVIAAVQGAAAGYGLSLMLACDLAIADDSAYFSTAYRHIGLTPDGGGTWFLPRLVGTRKAMELVLLGERFDAATALSLGLLNRVVPAGRLDEAVRTLAEALTTGPAKAIANGKRLVATSLGSTLSEQLQAEARSFAECAASADFAEGVRAFIDKRPPRFGVG